MRIACIFLALTFSAAAQSIPEIEIARARNLLASPQWSERAWGVYFAGQLRAEGLTEPIVGAFREAAALRDSTAGTEEHAYVAALFDAAIQSGIRVPAVVLEPFEEKWREPAIVLLAHLHEEEPLLKLDEENLPGAQWLAVNNELLERHSHGFFVKTLSEVAITHTFTLTDPGQNIGIGVGTGSGVCGDGIAAMPKGFPPVGLYEILSAGQPGDVLLASGPQDAYYRRTVVPTDKQVGFGSCGSGIDKQKIRVGYLAEINGVSEKEARNVFEQASCLEYRDDATLRTQWDGALSSQEAAVRGFVAAAQRYGWGTAAGVRLEITVKVDDLRTVKGATPPVTPREFVLD